MTDPEDAARRPELAVLSAMAHGEGEQGASIVAALLPALSRLDDERAGFYYDLVYNSLNEAARKALEAKMKGYEYQSDFAKKYVAQGEARGEARGERKALLRLLRSRFGELPAAALDRVEGADIAQIEQWVDRVLDAKSLSDVLDDPS